MAKNGSALASPAISRTLSQTIYNHLKQAIIKNQIKANQRILEKDIAAQFGISTTPVREAVLRLSAEGYIAIDSHRKATVCNISPQELENIYQVLSILESASAASLVKHATPETLSQLEHMTERMAAAARKRDAAGFLELNGQIHERLWRDLPNHVLQKTLLNVRSQLLRYSHIRIRVYKDSRILSSSLAQHREILASLRDRRGNALKSLLRQNWGGATRPTAPIDSTSANSIPEGGAQDNLTINRKSPKVNNIPNEEER